MSEFTLEELEAQAAAILAYNAHWKSCQDGSYEMAMHNSRYYQILERIKELKGK